MIKEGAFLLILMDRLVCWNVRGIKSHQKQLDVKKFLNMKNVGVVSLLKTKVKTPKLGDLYQRLFVGWCFTSTLVNHKGGRILLAWNPNSFHVNILKCTSQVIHCRFADRSVLLYMLPILLLRGLSCGRIWCFFMITSVVLGL